jgi:hypothetical protein
MPACLHASPAYLSKRSLFFCPTVPLLRTCQAPKKTTSSLVELLRLVRGGLFAHDGGVYEPFLSVAGASFFEKRDSRKYPVGSRIRTSDCTVNPPINDAHNPAAAAGGNNNFATRTRWGRWLRGSGEFVIVVVVGARAGELATA